MYKIVALSSPFSGSLLMKNKETGDVRFVSDISLLDMLKCFRVVLFVVLEQGHTNSRSYTVYGEDGSIYQAIADSLDNHRPDIPQWLIREWMKNPSVQFDVKFDPSTNLFHYESEISPEPSQQERELQAFLDKIKVNKDDFDVIQLTKSNNFMLRHKKSEKVVLLEKKFHKPFFAGEPYQIQQEGWKFGETNEEVLVLKPLTKIVIL